MIVACPACHTRYRQPAAGDAGSNAQCSRCNETFPLTPLRQSYRVLPENAPLSRTMTTPVEDLGEGLPEIPPPTGWHGDAPAEAEPAISTPSATVPELTESLDEGLGPAADAEADPPAGRRSSPLAEIAVAGLPAAAGSGLAYYLAGTQTADPVTWSALGAAAGFFVGWIGLQWMRRGS